MGAIESFARITPFLWFDANAEEAVEFYLSVFENSKRLGGSKQNGKTLTITFELDGLRFTALNGGPLFYFNESVSFLVSCRNQEEVDEYWVKLTEGGSESRCGWLKDKFGLSWQIVPVQLPELLKSRKAFEAMMQMRKLDLAELERAAESDRR